jgi:hypothetical protein
LLPLSGSPRLAVLGREVGLGNGTADLLAVEPSGRLVIVEVKLAQNAEARRAVVAQILAYAAFLRGTSLDVLEQQILRRHLLEIEAASIAALVAADDTDEFDAAEFDEGITESLREGRFRLVLVLDRAPEELVRLVGYLESIAPQLAIDLITVSAYDINGSRALVPQRVEPDRDEQEPTENRRTSALRRTTRSNYEISLEDFERTIPSAPEDIQEQLLRLYQWARQLQHERLAVLIARQGATTATLVPRVPAGTAGLVTIYQYKGRVELRRKQFERWAPNSIREVERVLGPAGFTRVIHTVDEALLEALTSAYREAAASSGSS